jgi:hypothetical protein
MSLEVLPLVAIAPVPIFWGTMILLGAPALYVRHQASRGVSDGAEPASRGRWLLELTLLSAPPLSMLMVGLHFWRQHSVSKLPSDSLAMSVLYSFATIHILLAMWLIWRHRQRLWSTFGVSAASTWWALGALFTASMAATNTWL